MSKKIVIYSKIGCSMCEQAKAYLEAYRYPYTLKVLGTDYTPSELQAIAPQAKTFPVIMIDDQFIGGYHQLTEYQL